MLLHFVVILLAGRETVEKDERRAAQHEKAVEALGARIAELEGSLEAARYLTFLYVLLLLC